jgi:hypothetical protein
MGSNVCAKMDKFSECRPLVEPREDFCGDEGDVLYAILRRLLLCTFARQLCLISANIRSTRIGGRKSHIYLRGTAFKLHLLTTICHVLKPHHRDRRRHNRRKSKAVHLSRKRSSPWRLDFANLLCNSHSFRSE